MGPVPQLVPVGCPQFHGVGCPPIGISQSPWILVEGIADSSCPPPVVTAHWVRTGDRLAAWVVAVGFKCPIPWATVNIILAWVLCFLLLLLSLQPPWSGCSSSVSLDRVIIHQLDCGSSPNTPTSVKVAKGSMAWCSSHVSSTSQWGLPCMVTGVFLPSTAGPWCRPGPSVTAPIYNPGLWNASPSLGGTNSGPQHVGGNAE